MSRIFTKNVAPQADVQTIVGDQNTDGIDKYSSVDGRHDRMEERSYRVYDVSDYLVQTH